MTTRRVKTPATTAIRVSKKPAAISRAVVGQRMAPAELSRTTNVAGADLARDSALSNISIPRALILTALGAAGGAVAAKLAKKPLGIGAGIGAGLGGAGSVAQNMLSDDQSVVESADVISTIDSAGRGGMTVVTIASKKRAVKVERTVVQKRKSFLITKAKSTEPVGWLGAVIGHGGCVQAGMMTYIKEHNNHVLPHLKIKPPEPQTSWTRSYDYWTLLTERFMEVPSPVFANCRAPMITYDVPHPWKPGASLPKHYAIFGGIDIEAAIGNVAWAATVLALHGKMEDYAHPYIEADPDYEFPSGDKQKLISLNNTFENSGWPSGKSISPAKNIEKWIKYSEEKRRFKGKNLTRDQYKDAVKRYFSRNGLSYDAYKEYPMVYQPAPMGSGAFAKGEWVQATSGSKQFVYPRIKGIPSYWNQSKQARVKWMNRLDHFYLNCQWLVWAAEMLRLHSKKEVWRNVLPSQRWRDHLLLWGIGRPDKNQTKDRLNMREYDGGTLERKQFLLEFNKKEVEEILDAVMYHTPPPCDPRFQGNQIAPGNQPRMMMDIPNTAGFMQPPVRVEDWLEGIGSWVGRHAGTTDPVMIGLKIWMSVCGAVAGSAMSTASSIGTSVMANTISQVVQSVYQTAIRGMTEPGGLQGSDIVKIVGAFAQGAISAAGVEAVGPLLDELGKQGADAAIQAIMDEIGPVLTAAELEGYLVQISGLYNTITNIDKWDYVDEAFGGLVSDLKAQATLPSGLQ